MKQRVQTVSVRREFPVSTGCLWSVAGHPSGLSPSVAMLRDFTAPPLLKMGSPLVETHTILGWPQRYRGKITRYDSNLAWAMTSQPEGVGPCPLPHDVEYYFEPQGAGSALTIRCDFKCGGLLALPFIPQIVEWFMRRTITNLLSSIAARLKNVSAQNAISTIAMA